MAITYGAILLVAIIMKVAIPLWKENKEMKREEEKNKFNRTQNMVNSYLESLK